VTPVAPSGETSTTSAQHGTRGRLGGVGIEVGPFPAGAGFERLAAFAADAEAAGLDTLWLRGAQVARALDPLTLAGALSEVTRTLVLGVVATLPDGRNPSVLARDLTTLDVVSGGRAAVCIEGEPGMLAEAAVVLSRLFSGRPASFSGVHFALHDAPNRPGPDQPGGPPIMVALPEGGLGALAADEVARECGAAVAAWVADVTPEALAVLRDERTTAMAVLGATASPQLLWRGPPAAAVAGRPQADGIIWRLGWPDEHAALPDLGLLERLAAR